MKLKNSNLIQKIALILICLLIFNFVVPTHISNADFGGVLFTPIKELFVTIGDIVLDVIDMGFTGEFDHVMWNMFAYKGSDNRFTGDDDNRSVLMSDMSPEAIFSNKVELLNVDFINQINEDEYSVKNDSATKGLISLRKTISAWYVAIRNFALVIMLSILVYVGIRIILCSVASEKAKYKQLLLDWIVGMCLLFMLHYLMSFSIMITEKITEMLSDATTSGISLQQKDLDGPTVMLPDAQMTVGQGSDQIVYKGENKGGASGGDEVEKLKNLTQYVRYYVDLRDLAPAFSYLIIYLFLVAYTVMFAVRYMKRMVIIAFLTMIAPFVAMTYPIDKMTDGKAQAFNFWLREYIFNLLIQPFHLVLYTVLVGTSTELVSSNLIYALVAIGCLLPAEKLLKTMFGFDKAHTPPGLAGPAMATAMANKLTGGAKNLMHGGISNNSSSKSSSDNGGDKGTPQKTRTKDYSFDSFEEGSFDGSNGLDGNSGAAVEGAGGLIGGAAAAGAAMDENNPPPLGGTNNPNPENLSDGDGGVRYSGNEFMDNNQQAELDAYANSPAYGNGSNNNNSNNNSNNSNNTPSKLGRAGQTAKTMGKNAGKLGVHAAKKIAKPKNIGKAVRFTAKAGARVAGAVGGGALGLAAGALTGKPGMAFSAMAAGAMMGNKAGAKVVDTGINAAGKAVNAGRNAIDGVTNFKNEALYGEQYAYEQKKVIDESRQRKNYAKDAANIKYFEQKTGASGKELKNIMERASYYDQMGAKDNDEVLKALELEQIYKQDHKMSDKQAQQLAGISAKMISEEGYKASDFADEKKRKAIENRTMSIVRENAGNLSEKQQTKLAQQIMSGNEYMAEVKKRQKDKMNYRK